MIHGPPVAAVGGDQASVGENRESRQVVQPFRSRRNRGAKELAGRTERLDGTVPVTGGEKGSISAHLQIIPAGETNRVVGPGEGPDEPSPEPFKGKDLTAAPDCQVKPGVGAPGEADGVPQVCRRPRSDELSQNRPVRRIHPIHRIAEGARAVENAVEAHLEIPQAAGNAFHHVSQERLRGGIETQNTALVERIDPKLPRRFGGTNDQGTLGDAPPHGIGHRHRVHP